MGTFKRLFTAPKTRDMGKKINSMKYCTETTKKLLEQIKGDAVFFKTCEEKFCKTIYYMTGVIDYRATLKALRGVEQNYNNIFQEIHAHKINWYYMDDKDISSFAKETNDKIESLCQKHRQTLNSFVYSLNRNIDECKTNSSCGRSPILSTQQQQFIESLTAYHNFCRDTKRTIKDIFEAKKKQFEREEQKEQTALKELNNLTTELQHAINATKLTDTINTWGKIEKSYATKKLTNVETRLYTITKNNTSNFIKTNISDLCNSIIEELESYIDAYRGKEDCQLTCKESNNLQNSLKILENRISQCTTADKNALKSICVVCDKLSSLRDFMHNIVSQFLTNTKKIKICEMNNNTFSFYKKGVDKILNEWNGTKLRV